MATREIVAHLYQDNPDARDTCVHCGLVDPKRTNKHHQLPDLGAANQEHRRRVGERDEED